MKQKYFSLVQVGNEANINIYGDITSWPWEELGEVSAHNLSKQLEEMENVSQINVHISSYGGEVKEGLAIYNALKQHKARIVTYCDGFACSIASVIFMAGDERVMNEASLLMIHNAWTVAQGNAKQLRKQADDLEIITGASVAAYKSRATISESEIKRLMNKETWITPAKAVEYGFATKIAEEKAENTSQNARYKLFDIVMSAQSEADEQEEDEEDKDIPEDEDEPSDDSSGSSDEEQAEDEGEEDPETEDEDEESGEEEEEKEEKTAANESFAAFFGAIFN